MGVMGRLEWQGHVSRQRRPHPAKVARASGQGAAPGSPVTGTSVNGAVTLFPCAERDCSLQSSSRFCLCEFPLLTPSPSDYVWPTAQVTGYPRCPVQSPLAFKGKQKPRVREPVPGSNPVPCFVRGRRRRVCNGPAFVCLLLGLTSPRKPVYFCFPLKDKGLVLPLEGKLTISVIPLAIQGSVTFRGAAAES